MNLEEPTMRPITRVLLVGLLLAAVALTVLARFRDAEPPGSACMVPGAPYEIQMHLGGDWLPASAADTQAAAKACIDSVDGVSVPNPLRVVHDGRVVYQHRPAGRRA
jgi:hypothetical protein